MYRALERGYWTLNLIIYSPRRRRAQRKCFHIRAPIFRYICAICPGKALERADQSGVPRRDRPSAGALPCDPTRLPRLEIARPGYQFPAGRLWNSFDRQLRAAPRDGKSRMLDQHHKTRCNPGVVADKFLRHSKKPGDRGISVI